MHSLPPLVLTCEHASHAVPPGVDLRVGDEVLRSHVSWDPGAVEVARRLADSTGAPLHVGRFSRLVVDLNRREEDAVPDVAFGVPVPGNASLPPEARIERIARWHRPWRRRARQLVEDTIARHGRCLHVSVHSFTPVLGEERREVQAGVLFDPARPEEVRVAGLLLETLRARRLDARPNEPWLGVADGLTTWLRTLFSDSVYAGIELEWSQGLSASATEAAAIAVAERLLQRW